MEKFFDNTEGSVLLFEARAGWYGQKRLNAYPGKDTGRPVRRLRKGTGNRGTYCNGVRGYPAGPQ